MRKKQAGRNGFPQEAGGGDLDSGEIQIHGLRLFGFLLDSFEEGTEGFPACQRTRQDVAIQKVSHSNAHFFTYFTCVT